MRFARLAALLALSGAAVGFLTGNALSTYTDQAQNTGNTIATASCFTGDTGFLNPNAEAADTGGNGNGFELNPTSAFADGGGYASNMNNQGTTGGDRHRFYQYAISFTEGCTVKGIEVRLDWWLDNLAGAQGLDVELSWDGGTSWTSAKSDPTESKTEHTALLGGSADTWGRAWTAADLSDANFRVRLTCKSTNNIRDFFLDWVPVRVYYGP